MNTKHLLCFTALLVLLVSTGASAGWEVTRLHPPGSEMSYALAVSGGQQVGCVDSHAALWNGTASWTDLGYYSESSGISGGKQVGYALVGGNNHASLWSGTAGSWVDLHPAGKTWSWAYAISGDQQAGFVHSGSYDHAGLWTGSAASFVDLNPAGSTSSQARGVSNGQQVGWADYAMSPHAALWSSTAASHVDLHPAGKSRSYAYGISDGQQVGAAYVGATGHAALWSGSAASFVDLNPAGYSASNANAVSHGLQAGDFVYTDGYSHAALWGGSAESWFDLQGLLGPDYISSTAHGIEVSGTEVWIVGWALTRDEYMEAVMWHNVIPEPSSLLALGSGLLVLGGLIRRRS